MCTFGFRHEVTVFAEAMEYKLRRNDHKGGWEGLSNDRLFELLEQEIKELREAINEGNRLEVILEAADVGNFALMLAWNAMKGAIDHGKEESGENPAPNEGCGRGTDREGRGSGGIESL